MTNRSLAAGGDVVGRRRKKRKMRTMMTMKIVILQKDLLAITPPNSELLTGAVITLLILTGEWRKRRSSGSSARSMRTVSYLHYLNYVYGWKLQKLLILLFIDYVQSVYHGIVCLKEQPLFFIARNSSLKMIKVPKEYTFIFKAWVLRGVEVSFDLSRSPGKLGWRYTTRVVRAMNWKGLPIIWCSLDKCWVTIFKKT